jgi:hypothetical protein
VTVVPDLAQRILHECAYDKQRPLNEDRALLFAEAIERGTYRKNSQLAFCRLFDRLILVDGQHRLNAVTLAGKPYPFRIEITDCETMAAVDAEYVKYDQPGGQRSLTQISKALGLHDEKLRPITATKLMLAMPFLMTGLKRIPAAKMPRETRDLDCKKLEAILWKPWAVDYQNCLDAGVVVRTARFRTGAVFAVAMATLRYQNEKAKLFWSEAVRNSGLASDDPRHALHQYFISSRRAETAYELAEAACHAWNAFFKGRQLTFCKSVGSELRPAGTPYQGD